MKNTVRLLIVIILVLICVGCHKHINDPMKGNGAFELSGILFCNHHPLVGAQVSIAENDKFTATSTDSGTFVMHDLPQGNYTLQIDKTFNDNAFLQVTRTVTIKGDLALDTLYLPLAPRLYQVAENRQNSVSLRWNVTDATDFKSYRLYRHNSDTISDESGDLVYTGTALTDTTFQDTTLQSATTYYYRLYTFTAQGKIGGSNVLTATTKDPEPPLIFFGNENSSDNITDFKSTTDGGIIIAGYTTPSSGINNAWCIKLDATMQVQWNKVLDKESAFNSVIHTADGGFVFTGSAGEDVLVLKTDAAGNTEWEKTVNDVPDAGMDILQTNDGDYYVISYTCQLLKLDSNGNQQWKRRLSTTQKGSKIINANDGGYVVSVSKFVWNSSSLKFLKIDDEGSILKESESFAWRSGGNMYNTIDQNGYLIVGGAFYEGSSYMSYIKIDNQVNVLWEKRLSGHGSSGYLRDDGTFYGVGFNSDDNVYGFYPSHPWIVHIDSEGNVLKDINIGETAWYFEGYGILNYDQEHYILIGTKDRLCDPQYWINKDLDAFVTIRPWSELE
ncbi:MAG TPA: hypothetical protein PLI87_07415 [bacterium]|nr:hypothetical protein [bacterium]